MSTNGTSEAKPDRLSDAEFQQYCVPYLKRLIEATHVPVILFMRGASHRVDELVKLTVKHAISL